MMLRYAFLLALCALKSRQVQYRHLKIFNSWPNSLQAPHRVLELMRSYYEEANVRVADMNDMRFMYEESPQYEQGYIMGEIVERYRKMVEHTQRTAKSHADNLFDTLKRVELIQKLYFELYHLVRMMHEIPLKYVSVAEFAANNSLTYKELVAAEQNIIEIQKRREKLKKKRLKNNAKLRELYIKGMAQAEYGKKRLPYNSKWPLDYGWEIESW